ncbi:hypothetical protein O181_007726 [Austropuccinia psidii MF-1]|uniref:Uncharacterized protein n=1 Tax=Austropuccinia psidii MF-1 TaxID=1389203 RepID=A0A9Q3GHV5_9BASI|nr:hypothetical protein [Austropuccinia psidii MF-1]
MHQEDFFKKILDELNITNLNRIKTPTPMNISFVLEAELSPIEASYWNVELPPAPYQTRYIINCECTVTACQQAHHHSLETNKTRTEVPQRYKRNGYQVHQREYTSS